MSFKLLEGTRFLSKLPSNFENYADFLLFLLIVIFRFVSIRRTGVKNQSPPGEGFHLRINRAMHLSTLKVNFPNEKLFTSHQRYFHWIHKSIWFRRDYVYLSNLNNYPTTSGEFKVH